MFIDSGISLCVLTRQTVSASLYPRKLAFVQLARFRLERGRYFRNFNGCRHQSEHATVRRTPKLPLPNKYFLTTPIYYLNSVPHIGHLYTNVVADAVSRWYSLLGVPVLFSTGTDEHGLKVQQAALAQNKEPQEFCDQMSAEFKKLFQRANINYSDYIRTTEGRHHEAVHKIWERLQSRGFIYKGRYEGWYSVPDETFVGEDQVTDAVDGSGNTRKVFVESGHPVEWMKEENYMFRLSAFEKPLTEWLDKKGEDTEVL